MLRNLEYIACYYITGSFNTQDYGYCLRTKKYRDLAYAVSFIPYYWRAMQVYIYIIQTCFLNLYLRFLFGYGFHILMFKRFCSALGGGSTKAKQATL